MITVEDIKEAYLKLKNIAYYDNSNLFLKQRIAKFERQHYEDNLDDIFEKIKESIDEQDEDYWQKLFKNTRLRALPKSFDKEFDQSNGEESKDKKPPLIENLFSNNREKKGNNYWLKRVTVFADAEIETYILSILWITKIGHWLEDEFYEKCYGNRLLRKTRQ